MQTPRSAPVPLLLFCAILWPAPSLSAPPLPSRGIATTAKGGLVALEPITLGLVGSVSLIEEGDTFSDN